MLWNRSVCRRRDITQSSHINTMLFLSKFVMSKGRPARNYLQSYEKEKEFVEVTIKERNPEDNTFFEVTPCEFYHLPFPIRRFMSMNIPKRKSQFVRYAEVQSWNKAAVFVGEGRVSLHLETPQRQTRYGHKILTAHKQRYLLSSPVER